MKIRTLIVDDEVMARTSLERYCQKNEHIELLGLAENGKKALEFMKGQEVELILLDIEMPELTGIELLDQLPYLPQIVFTTSNTEYAYDAYEYDVTDFLKKPITPVRFAAAIEKVILRRDKMNSVASLSATREMYIRDDGKLIRIPYDQILYFENVGDYISIKTTKGNHIMYGTMKALDGNLENPTFLKVHRSYIVNLEKIKDIQDNSLVIEGKVIPISRAHKPLLIKSLNIIS